MSMPTAASRIGGRTTEAFRLIATIEDEPFRCMENSLSSLIVTRGTAQQRGADVTSRVWWRIS